MVSGIETTVSTYTANLSAICFLQFVEIYGTNASEYRFYKNATLINKKYTSVTEFGSFSDYRTQNDLCPGLRLANGDVITVKVIHDRPSSGDFNGRIQILEVS